MKKFIPAIILVLVLSIGLAGCGTSKGSNNASSSKSSSSSNTSSKSSGSSSKGVLTLKLGHIQTQDSLWQQGAEKFKQEVEAKSNGKIKIQIYPNSTLGGDRTMAEGMQMGSVDFALVAGVLGNFAPSIQLLNLPYLFQNQSQFDKVVHGKIGQEISANVLNKAHIRVLDYWDRGPRELTSNKPINSIKDIQGLKIRLPQIPAMVNAWKAMGAAPTTMAWSEVYTGLQQHVIDAQENPIPFIYAGHINEVQKYLAMTNHNYEFVTLSMSDKTWQKLNPAQRKIVTEAANDATKYEDNLVKTQTQVILKKMEKNGLKVTHPNTAPFAKAALKADDKTAKTINEKLYQQIKSTINQ